MVATPAAKRHAARVVKRLFAAYPDARCSLDHRKPLELLVATILSAQCTDARVNLVTPGLFKAYPTAAAYAAAPITELEKAIQSTGFFRNKAKSIKACCRQLVDEHGGKVPRDMEDLVKLQGVGRKTANVVRGVAFGLASGVVVDTHVGRLSRRLGLSAHANPVKVEQDLMEVLPKNTWVEFSHAMIQHGRRICLAQRPKCDACFLAGVCPRIGVTNGPI